MIAELEGCTNLCIPLQPSYPEIGITPPKFLANKPAKAPTRKLATQSPNLEIAPVRASHGGSTPSTYVARELVYAYAMWVSAAFALKVIRTYDAFMQAQIDRLNTLLVQVANRRKIAGVEFGWQLGGQVAHVTCAVTSCRVTSV